MSESDGSPSPQESQDAPHGSTSDPMRSTEDISKRADIRAARVETRLAPLGVDRVYRRRGVILVGISFLPLDYDRLAYERGGAVSCMGYARHVFFAFTRSGAPRLALRAGPQHPHEYDHDDELHHCLGQYCGLHEVGLWHALFFEPLRER